MLIKKLVNGAWEDANYSEVKAALDIAEITPEDLAGTDFYEYHFTEPPAVENGYSLEESAELVNGVLTQVWTQVPPSDDSVRQIISELRYNAEISGIEFNGMQIPTDRHTQSVLTAMRLKVVTDPNYAVSFKVGDTFVPLDAAAIIAVSDAVHDHVQACFAREEELLDEVQNGGPISWG